MENNSLFTDRPLCTSIEEKMSAPLKNALAIYNRLIVEWNKQPPNLTEVGRHLAALKVASSYGVLRFVIF